MNRRGLADIRPGYQHQIAKLTRPRLASNGLSRRGARSPVSATTCASSRVVSLLKPRSPCTRSTARTIPGRKTPPALRPRLSKPSVAARLQHGDDEDGHRAVCFPRAEKAISVGLSVSASISMVPQSRGRTATSSAVISLRERACRNNCANEGLTVPRLVTNRKSWDLRLRGRSYAAAFSRSHPGWRRASPDRLAGSHPWLAATRRPGERDQLGQGSRQSSKAMGGMEAFE